MKVNPIRTSIFMEGDYLTEFILKHIPRLKDRSIIVITSKIVALAEQRTVIIKDEKTKERLIKSESDLAVPTPTGFWLTIKDSSVMASAGIDESNAQGKLILLPKDSFKTARELHRTLKKRYKVKNLGILITDSRVIAFRTGTSGFVLGYAGIKGLRDYRGQPDIFGRKSRYTQANIADSLAAAAVLTMGEGKEQQPLAIIENAPVVFTDRVNRRELLIDVKDDLYRPLFGRLPKSKKKRGKS